MSAARTHITLDDLAGACEDARARFQQLWPSGRAKITAANMRKAIKAGLDVWWLERLIPACVKEKCDADHAAIWAKYDADHAAILAKYEADHAPLRAKYEADHAPLRAKYEADHAAIIVAALTVQP